MFRKVREFIEDSEVTLEVDTSGEPTAEDLQIATGVFLLEMAGRDEDFAPEEVKAVFATMKRQFSIEESDAMAILEKSQELLGHKGKLSQLTESVNQHFSEEQRTIVLGMVWKVVLADGNVDKFEERFFEELRNRLRLSEESGLLARRMVETGQV